MRIIALNPPFMTLFSRESRSPAVAKSGTFYYPMWLAYATGYLEQKGHTVKLIDAVAGRKSVEDLIGEAKAFGPSILIVDTSTPSIYNDISVAAAIKKEIPGLFVVLVGPHVSAVPVETLEIDPVIDAVAFGEYDATLADLASKIESTDNRDSMLQSVPGIAFRSSDGKVLRNGERQKMQDLDRFPFVTSIYQKHLDVGNYFYSHSRYPLVTLITSRGCPYRCTYCVVPQTLQGHQLRKRSIENVVAEFQYIAKELPFVKEIMIEDDTLTADKKRCREFAKALIDAGATTIRWTANSRADVDYETLRLMQRAGCRLLCVGFESGEQQILENIQKGTTVKGYYEFIKNARKAGILVHGCFMFGNRGETKETLEKTLAMAKKLNPDTAQFYPIMVYPGTSDFQYFKEKGWVTTEDYRKWLTPDGLHSSVVSNPDLTYEELVSFCDRCRREYYFRPGYMLSKMFQIVRHPSEAPRILKAGKRAFQFLLKPSLKSEQKADSCKSCSN